MALSNRFSWRSSSRFEGSKESHFYTHPVKEKTLPIYSLRNHSYSDHPFNKRIIFHISSAIFRCCYGLICLLEITVVKHFFLPDGISAIQTRQNKLTPTVNPLLDLLQLINRIHSSVTLFCGSLLLITGAFQLWILFTIVFSPKKSSRFLYENVLLRVVFMSSSIHAALLYSILHLTVDLISQRLADQGFGYFLIWDIVLATINILTLFVLPLLWLGRGFKFYTFLSLGRFFFAAFIMSLTLFMSFSLGFLQPHLESYIAFQVSILKEWLIIHGLVCWVVSVISSLYSLVATFYRSAILVALDGLFLSFIVWIPLCALFSFSWPFSIFDFLLKVSRENDPSLNRFFNLFKNFLYYKAVLDFLITFFTLITLITSICFLFVPFLKPLEWTIPRLVEAYTKIGRHRPSLIYQRETSL